ncbi:MAG TPA: metal ABC transporter ATP-binding protein [Candidatus Paceibacterota bacterium]|nr:metal ABC transporter ATP-binding protein [Candidatus Paceibacterota bacterium]
MSKVLTVSDLSVSFNGHAILKDLSFDLDAGSSLAVIGPNGSGKTVLLKTLLGLMPNYQGTVTWAPNVKLGYVPQKIDADRHLPINVQNLLEAKAHTLGLHKNDVAIAAKTVGLAPNILHIPVGHLSGGQFQKALIAFALLGNPNVILFDEPTASLDELSEEHIYDLIHNLQDERGITTILVSHDLSVVYQYSQQVLCVNKERICFGPPESITPDILQKLYGDIHKYVHHIVHEHHEEHD